MNLYFLPIGLALALLGLLIGRRLRPAQVETVVVDKSGIQSPAAMTFVDVWSGKTINFKVANFNVSFCQLPVIACLEHLRQLQVLYQALRAEVVKEDALGVKEAKALVYYSAIVNVIFGLTKSFIPKGKVKKYKKELFKKAESDTVWTLDLTEQLTDYWSTVKKKIELQALGKTLLATAGERFSWNSLNVDSHGTIVLRPRFGLHSKS